MYATSTSSTTSGSRSGRPSAAASGSGERRVRVLRLVRPRRSAPAFGFSLRGGREHATGFFISKVEFNSEAQVQGLKVGDQIVSVNGFRVEDAVHSELVHYLASQTRLKIKVRHVGMVPIKDKSHEPLSWQFVSEQASLCSEASSSPTLCRGSRELRLSLLVPPRAKLGCGICKGPDWKPGIFVQFVREGGIAREAGLRPGDQILSCNGIDFTNIPFNDAIPAMKAAGRLELVVREGAGAELASPESSGYNSSASSAAGGERSPAPTLAPAPAALSSRLDSVAEEPSLRPNRLLANRLKRRTWDSLDFDWTCHRDVHNFDAPSDIEPDYDSPSIPNNPHNFDNKWHGKCRKEFTTTPSNRTIINLTEDGATIQCSYSDNNAANRKATFVSNREDAHKDADKKTIVVEVHHNGTTNCLKSHCSFPPPPMRDFAEDTASVSSSATLSSAIAEEIQKRRLNKKMSAPEERTYNAPIKKNNAPKPADCAKKTQHDALMDEFKKLHRKMFANQEKDDSIPNGMNGNATDADRQSTFQLRKTEHVPEPVVKTNKQIAEPTDIPPPPPPMPKLNGNGLTNGSKAIHADLKKTLNQEICKNQLNGSSDTIKINGDSNTNSNRRSFDEPTTKFSTFKTNTLTRTPTPDYNKSNNKGKDEKADLDSLESFKLNNLNSNSIPKPPPNYFTKACNGTATMKKQARPVSVTIGEYGCNGASRKEPSKLEFLNGADRTDGGQNVDSENITNRLQSELAMTLSRSNLRKKTEALGNDFLKMSFIKNGEEDSDASLDKNFHARYGNYIHPLPPTITIPKATKIKN